MKGRFGTNHVSKPFQVRLELSCNYTANAKRTLVLLFRYTEHYFFEVI